MHSMLSNDRDLTTPAGKRFLSNAVAFKIVQRLVEFEVTEAEAETVADLVATALKGQPSNTNREYVGFVRRALTSRDVIENYLVRYHTDMIKLGAPPKLCGQELLHAVCLLHRLGMSAVEARHAVKH
jgi:hypothetical protein